LRTERSGDPQSSDKPGAPYERITRGNPPGPRHPRSIIKGDHKGRPRQKIKIYFSFFRNTEKKIKSA
jgi:hypothetical protein